MNGMQISNCIDAIIISVAQTQNFNAKTARVDLSKGDTEMMGFLICCYPGDSQQTNSRKAVRVA